MPDILDDLKDLHKQATTERSHYYVASCCERAIAEIESLRRQWRDMACRILTEAQQTNEMVRDANARIDHIVGRR